MQYEPITEMLAEAIKELKEKFTALANRQKTLGEMFLAISANLQNEKSVKYEDAELDEAQKVVQ